MDPIPILLSAFILSTAALALFIWSLRRGLFDREGAGADVIFAAHEIGQVEDPAAVPREQAVLQEVVDRAGGPHDTLDAAALAERATADRSTATVTFVFFSCAVVWLLVASAAGLVASIKLHAPDWLGAYEWLTFGRIRTLHLNAIGYGWAPMAGFGIALWLLPRLLKTPLVGRRYALLGAMLWNSGLIAGMGAIAVGITDGLEWLEMPRQIAILLVVGGGFIGLPMVFTLSKRKVHHLYVSVWYMAAAVFWAPVLFFVASIPGLHFGVEQATMNWWFGHNVIGLIFTPLAVASIYYFLPKVIGRPVQSYNLSLLGFWTLAFFYGQVGGHHLIGGPVPGWMVTLSIVQSIMMIIPVAAFAVNQHLTLRGYYRTLAYSPTLRFVVLGGIMYVLSSFQGSLEALRSVNTVTHFTHFTVAHAHLGLYAFVTMVFFGGMYFIMPRVMQREWPYPRLITVHFWLVVIGMAIYIIALSIGGWLQGLAMLDAKQPFINSVLVTLPYLKARSLGGALMTLGHLVFATHFAVMVLTLGPVRDRPAVFQAAKEY